MIIFYFFLFLSFFLFIGISTLMGYFIPNSSLAKNSCGTIETIAGRIKEAIAFPNEIIPKVNVIAQVAFELA